ncbi:type II secretion system protein [Microbacterium sp.]|uniref:type II secretion system protein n=1 Tax=Microbacterium sp. TaxID=51671 RepID=UPI0025DB25FE|nr:type II secretion system protein [Microbacterium sp.]
MTRRITAADDSPRSTHPRSTHPRATHPRDAHHASRSIHTDDGFSIVELVIAMFLVAILAMAVLPLLVQGTRASASNTSLVAATTFAGERLAFFRDQFPSDILTTTCTAVQAHRATGIPDPARSGLSADILVSECPADLPGTVTVTARVYESADPTAVLATVPTRIVVSSP